MKTTLVPIIALGGNPLVSGMESGLFRPTSITAPAEPKDMMMEISALGLPVTFPSLEPTDLLSQSLRSILEKTRIYVSVFHVQLDVPNCREEFEAVQHAIGAHIRIGVNPFLLLPSLKNRAAEERNYRLFERHGYDLTRWLHLIIQDEQDFRIVRQKQGVHLAMPSPLIHPA